MDLTPASLPAIVRDFIEGRLGPRGFRRAVWPALMGEAFDQIPLATAVERCLSQMSSGTLTAFQARWQLGNDLASSLTEGDRIIIATDTPGVQYHILPDQVIDFTVRHRSVSSAARG